MHHRLDLQSLLIAVLLVGNFFLAWHVVPRLMYVWKFQHDPVRQVDSLLRDANVSFMHGNFDLAIQEATKAISIISPSDSARYYAARQVLGLSYFWSGDRADRIKTIEILKEEYQRPGVSDIEKAHLINALIGCIASADEPYVVDAVFAGEPFQSLVVPGDQALSDRHLAEQSIALYPTSNAYIWVAIYHASQLFKDAQGATPLTPAEREAHVVEIQQTLAVVDQLFASEKAAAIAAGGDQDISWVSYELWYYHFQGFLEGAIALVHPDYLPRAQASIQKTFDLYADYRTHLGLADTTHLFTLEQGLPYAHLSYALYTYRIGGEAQLPVVKEQLEKIVEIVHADPALHAGAFVAFIHQIGSEKDNDSLWMSPRNFRAMAALSPEFKALLVENGWKL